MAGRARSARALSFRATWIGSSITGELSTGFPHPTPAAAGPRFRPPCAISATHVRFSTGPPLALSGAVRGLQWWNSSSSPLGDPDGMVWTDVRTLRRLRAVRRLKVALAVVLAAALGTAIVVAFAQVRTSPPPALRLTSG